MKVSVFVTRAAEDEHAAPVLQNLGAWNKCRVSTATSERLHAHSRIGYLCVSLVVALAGVILCYLCDIYRLHAPEPSTLVLYTLKSRCVPVVTVVLAMIVAAVAGDRIISCSMQERDASDEHTKPLLVHEYSQAEVAPPDGHHDVRAERPDIDALVRGAVVQAKMRLIVAACGPAALVKAVGDAVAAGKQQNRHTKVEISFSGSDPAW